MRGEVSVPTSDARDHSRAATGRMPRASQSRITDPTDSPRKTRPAASRSAGALTGCSSSRKITRLRATGSSGLAYTRMYPNHKAPPPLRFPARAWRSFASRTRADLTALSRLARSVSIPP